ncbi:YbaY family lipoprotein [Ferrimonas pelagia]|uniref:YbaY family lipoprotein n=1 Tax=Ferrimonas pelagia TaxID=1177826 RepID=A0ABP9EEQ5_9GAMM
MFRAFAAALLSLLLTACVTVDESKEDVVRLSGVVTFKEATLLPANSSIMVAVIDADKPGMVLDQKDYEVGKLPVPFFFAIPKDQIDKRANYVVWASVRVQGQTILHTQRQFPVINNGALTATVLVEAAR